MYWSLRRKDLCPGTHKCPQGVVAECQECKTTWTIYDPLNPGWCPQCEAANYIRNRCGNCPEEKLDLSLSWCEAGSLLSLAAEFETYQRRQLVVSADDVRADVYEVLTIIEKERERIRQEDELKKAPPIK